LPPALGGLPRRIWRILKRNGSQGRDRGAAKPRWVWGAPGPWISFDSIAARIVIENLVRAIYRKIGWRGCSRTANRFISAGATDGNYSASPRGGVVWIVSVTQQSRTEKTESNEDDSTLLKGSRTISMPTGGLRLMASCAFARHPRPDLSRRFQVRGANGDRY
jgi:hypothetical protein